MLEQLRRFDDWTRRHERLVATATYAVLLLLLLSYVLKTPLEIYGPHDGRTYVTLARKAAAAKCLFGCGNFLHAYWSPLWVATAAAVLKLTGGGLQGIRLLLVIAALLSSLTVYLWARRYTGPSLALLGGILSVGSMLVFRFIVYYHYEVFLGWLLITFAWIVTEPLQDSRWTGIVGALAGGLTLGAASLVASKAAVLALTYPAALAGRNARRVWLLWPTLLLGMLIVLVPWWVRNIACLDEWIPFTSNGGINLYIANNPYASTKGYHFPRGEPGVPDAPFHESSVWTRAALEYMRSNPAQTLERMAIRSARFFNPHYGDQFPLILLFLYALYRGFRSGRIFARAGFRMMVCIPFVFLLVHTIFHYEFRYILPVWPAMAWISVVGLAGWRSGEPNQ
jgi:hypothetical protein